MQTFFLNYGLFLLKIITVVVATLILLAGMIAIIGKNKIKPKEKIVIKKLNEKFDNLKDVLHQETLSKLEYKKITKNAKKQKKSLEKSTKNLEGTSLPRSFVLDFVGDLRASAVANLREEITAILTVATPKDEVVIKIESPGGMVNNYGLAASQLQRIRDRHIPLIACVDKVAASGGYMMACVADRILAAPFAILGSIGVIAQLPNFHRFLKKNNIDFEQFYAGDFKRTISLFGENTSKGREKLQEEIEEAHELFKEFVTAHRPNINIETIATGEHWYGIKAKELYLIDEIMTSDDYLLKASAKTNLFQITYSTPKGLIDKLSLNFQKAWGKILGDTI